MKRLLLLFTLFAIITSQSGIEDCSSFESSIALACSSLGNTDNRCYYTEGQCKSSLHKCEDYNPSSNFNDQSCTSIIPDDYQMVECVVDGNPKKCVPKKKSCEQTTDETVCPNLEAGTDKRCVFTNGKCEAHYNECSKASQNECNNNIPQNSKMKCNWDSSCQEKDRECNKYITYTDINGRHAGNQYCYQLKADDDNDQVCILDEGNCKSVYKSCDKGNGDETKCKGIKPLNDYYFAFNSNKYCSYSASNCIEKVKNCNQYIKGTGSQYCTSLEAENKSKKCVYDVEKDECTEQYTSCSSYSSDTSVTTPKSDDCKKINPIDSNGFQYLKCELEGDQCREKQKDCNDIKDKETCNEYNSYLSTKYCLFLERNNTCVNSFKTCEEYKTNPNQNDCELIQPNYYDSYIYTYKCIFNAADESCERQKMTCEDYQGNDGDECSKISYNLDDRDTYSCRMIDGKCKKEYRYCTDYKGTDKAKCEAIRVDPYKCVYDTKDKECYQEYGTCNEYKGTDPTICSYYDSNDENKRCILVNGKCVEKEYYYHCSDYEGTNKDVCQSIIPVNDRTKKCVYTNEGCVEQNKVCEDARDESECTNIIASDSTKKQCVFINNACKEQFKDCDTYNSENSVDEGECESIVLNDKYDSDSYKYRCKYTASTNGGKGTCTKVARNCDDFDVELIRKQCSSISLMDYLKKCTFNSNDKSCSIKEKTCLDMSYISYYPSEEYCNKLAVSSSNKICVAGRNGCIEVEKEKNSNNSSFELKLSQMVFILLFLLF